MKTIIDDHQVELLVSETGRAILLHEGSLLYDYVWIQYDRELKTLSFITEEGDVSELGMPIHQVFEERLLASKELVIITINKDKSRNYPVVIPMVRTSE